MSLSPVLTLSSQLPPLPSRSRLKRSLGTDFALTTRSQPLAFRKSLSCPWHYPLLPLAARCSASGNPEPEKEPGVKVEPEEDQRTSETKGSEISPQEKEKAKYSATVNSPLGTFLADLSVEFGDGSESTDRLDEQRSPEELVDRIVELSKKGPNISEDEVLEMIRIVFFGLDKYPREMLALSAGLEGEAQYALFTGCVLMLGLVASASVVGFRDEEGKPVGGESLSQARAFLSRTVSIDERTLETLQNSLFGPSSADSPFVVSGRVDLGSDVYGAENPCMYLGSLRPGVSPSAAAQVLRAAVRDRFPSLCLTITPFPLYEETYDAYVSSALRGTPVGVAVFRKFSIFHVAYLKWFLIPSLIVSWIAISQIPVVDQGVNSDFSAAQEAFLFTVAAFLPAFSAYCGDLIWTGYYKVPAPVDATVIPSLDAGIISTMSRVPATPSSRKASLDSGLFPSLAALASSVFLLRSGSCSGTPTISFPIPSLEAFGSLSLGATAETAAAASAAIPGTVLVHGSFLNHASLLNQMADRLSCASFPDPSSNTGVLLAVPTLSLAGLLGLHLSALQLLPVPFSSGGRMADAFSKDFGVVLVIQGAAITLAFVSLFLTGAPTWIVFLFSGFLAGFTRIPTATPSMKWDNVTPPGALRVLFSALLMCGGVLLLLPPQVLSWLAPSGIKEVGTALLSALTQR